MRAGREFLSLALMELDPDFSPLILLFPLSPSLCVFETVWPVCSSGGGGTHFGNWRSLFSALTSTAAH